jgi:hypothetical protein
MTAPPDDHVADDRAADDCTPSMTARRYPMAPMNCTYARPSMTARRPMTAADDRADARSPGSVHTCTSIVLPRDTDMRRQAIAISLYT